MRAIFETFDESGDGEVTTEEFRHIVRRICRGLSEAEVEELVNHVDRNRDGVVDFDEFLAVVNAESRQVSAPCGRRCVARAAHPSAPPQGRGLFGKLVRSQMPSPLEHLLAFANMPKHFRPSVLAALESRPLASLSGAISPVLEPNGLTFRHLALDPETRELRQVPPRPRAKSGGMLGGLLRRDDASPARVGTAGALGASRGGAARGTGRFEEKMRPASAGGPGVAAGGAGGGGGGGGLRGQVRTIEVELVEASGVAMPDDENREHILCRRVRLCLFEADQPVSNIHISKADWRPEEEDRWRLASPDHELNRLVMRTDRLQTTLLIELCLIVLRPKGDDKNALRGRGGARSGSGAASAGAGAVKRGGAEDSAGNGGEEVDRAFRESAGHALGSHRGYASSELLEMTCGFCTLDWLAGEDAGDEVRTVELPINGGTFEAQQAIDPNEILARRTGWRKVAKLFSGATVPKLTLKLRPLSKIRGSRDSGLPDSVLYLPPGVLVPSFAVRLVHLFYEILADRVLRPRQPLQSSKWQDLPVRVFLRAVDEGDALTALSELWQAKMKNTIARLKRDTVGGGSNVVIKAEFRKTLIELYPVLCSHTLPRLVLGLNDAERLALIRSAMYADPLATLSADAMLSRAQLGQPALGMEAQGVPDVLFSQRMLYRPFHTRELAFDHTAHTERLQRIAQHKATQARVPHSVSGQSFA
jgi:hypothetical protein